MIAMLIRSGHVNVLEYGYAFFSTALEELDESLKSALTDMAVATRAAGVSPDDWKKFMNSSDVSEKPKVKRKTSKGDHAQNMAAIRGLGK